ncbi:hypothetical protein [Spongiactinospora sp. 9N601]
MTGHLQAGMARTRRHQAEEPPGGIEATMRVPVWAAIENHLDDPGSCV